MVWLFNFWRHRNAKEEAADSKEERTPATSPSQTEETMQKFTAEELAACDGQNGTAIYISVKGKVYDCTTGGSFYGPGKAYAVFAGKEVSRSLGKMMINDIEANTGWTNLSAEHMQTLDEWVSKFESKYPVIGTFQPDKGFDTRQAQFEP